MLRCRFLCHDLKALFFIKIALKLSYFCKKNAKFRALGAPPPDPRASGDWGLYPQTPSLWQLGASPPDPHWHLAAAGSAHCEFLATRLTPSVMQKFSSAFGWVNSDTENWFFVGYYDIQYTCSTDFLANEDFRPAHYLSITFVFFNLIVSLLILISYILVSIKIYKNESLSFVPCKGCMLWRNCCEKVLGNNAFFQETNSFRSAENQEMFKRISFIVLTDLFWIPLFIASLVI